MSEASLQNGASDRRLRLAVDMKRCEPHALLQRADEGNSMRRAFLCLIVFFVSSILGLGVSAAQNADADKTAAPASPAATATPAPSPSAPVGHNGGSTPSPSPVASGAQKPASAGVFALVVDSNGAQALLGLPVKTSQGEDLGHVVDVVVGRNNAPLAAVVDFGGFLGVGSRKIAVDWRLLHFPNADGLKNLVADLPLDQLREAPAVKPGEPIVIMGAAAAPAPTPSPSPTTASQGGAKP